MPVPILVPADIPCPQTSSVTPEEGRLITEADGVGPVESFAIELDERQTQPLTWMVNAAQAESWKRWYRVDLVFGGAWFAAPATWPAVEGIVVKTRRFLGDPVWSYLGVGFWNISALTEVRGDTEEPLTPLLGWNTANYTGGWEITEQHYRAAFV